MLAKEVDKNIKPFEIHSFEIPTAQLGVHTILLHVIGSVVIDADLLGYIHIEPDPLHTLVSLHENSMLDE